VKVGLWLEGSTDEAFFPPLVARVLHLQPDAITPSNRRGTCIEGVKRGLPEQVEEFVGLGCTHIVVGADNHQATPSQRAKLMDEVRDIVQPSPCVVGVAVLEVEAWFLADYVTLANVMAIAALPKPTSVEDMADPKRELKERTGRSPTLTEIRQFARSMDLERARKEAPSLDRFLKDLEAWKVR
jgi:hypothetical protein